MRISANPDEPGYIADRSERRCFLVALDGQPMHDVISADEEAGQVTRTKRDDLGQPMHADGFWLTETMTGRVTITKVKAPSMVGSGSLRPS